MKSNIQKVYSKLPKTELSVQKVELGITDDLRKYPKGFSKYESEGNGLVSKANKVKEELKENCSSIQFTKDPYEAAKDAHAIAILTEWDEFRDLDYEKIFASMEKPAFIFDGRDLLDHEKLFKIGFNVAAVGKPLMTHF